MKAGGRVRFFVTLLSILVATAVVGVLIYQTTFDTLRKSYQQMLDRTVDQGTFLVESYLNNQFALLSLYASVPSVQEGRFSDLPKWLKHPGEDGFSPKRLAILDQHGQGVSTTGDEFNVQDRDYFRIARAGIRNVEGPVVSRIDRGAIVVMAQPIPGDHPGAAVLTASIDLAVFRSLLDSLQGLAGVELTLSESSSQVLATTATPFPLVGGELLESSQSLRSAPWTLTARTRVADLLQPVRTVLLVVAILVVTGVGLIIVFFLTGLRHRLDLDQAKEDRTQALRDAYEQIRKLAYNDTVTRLPNRNLVVRKIGEALQTRAPQVVAVVALGRFRNLTTTFGMHFGDTVLKEAASRLASFALAEKEAFLGRLGESEFILMLDESRCGPGFLHQIIALFDEPMGRDDLRLHISVHVGASRLLESGKTAEEVIKGAETALWAAREKGTSEASELTAEAVEQRLRRAQLQKLLPEALARGELEVHYQPQVNLKTGETVGYEALMRWFSPELGSVCPTEFIPIAEETAVIVSLGYWVLDQGIAFAQSLQARGIRSVVSVNVSAVQFLHHRFLDEVGRRIEASGLPPWSMGLEITESTLMEGIDQLRPSLDQLMARGVKVSLDDFGTGYSSLNYLRELPLHVLKIDKSFVDALEGDEKARHLIRCIIELAHHLGLVVTAEGIETQQQQDLLADVGCDQVQGFLTGSPQPADVYLVRR